VNNNDYHSITIKAPLSYIRQIQSTSLPRIESEKEREVSVLGDF